MFVLNNKKRTKVCEVEYKIRDRNLPEERGDRLKPQPPSNVRASAQERQESLAVDHPCTR